MPRGGRRAGAGRKSKAPIPFSAKQDASSILAKLGNKTRDGRETLTEEDHWLALLHGKDARLRFDVLRYLTDRRDGKPKQSVEHSGEIDVTHQTDDQLSADLQTILKELRKQGIRLNT